MTGSPNPTVAPPPPAGAYAPSVRRGNHVFTAGMCGYHADRSLADGLENQIRLALQNLQAALAQQSATLTDVVSVNVFLSRSEDFDAMNAALAPFYKQINTLGVYEQRKRRAAQETLAQYNELVEARLANLAKASRTCKVLQAQGKPFIPSEFGFVYPLPEIENYIVREAVFAEAEKLIKRA